MSAPAGVPATSPARPLRKVGWALVVVGLLMVLPFLRSGTELVRVRNALSVGAAFRPATDDWRPPAVPPDFRVETVSPDPFFVEVAARLDLAAAPDDWARARAISRHLVGSAPQLLGEPLHRDLHGTYRGIVEEGGGYCGDFVRAFTAIANVAGLTVRPWAFSFDGFGGHGHIWLEIWNRSLERWQLVDVFNNAFYVKGDATEPLSALELRQLLLSGGSSLRRLPLDERRPLGFVEDTKGREYLMNGLHEWYLPWGTNVQTIDASPWVQRAGRVARSLEQLATIASGLQPRIRVLVEPANSFWLNYLHVLRLWVLAAGLAVLTGVLVLLYAGTRPGQRRAAPVHATLPDGAWPRVALVGPLPPPSGGMANQCEQLLRLLRADGAEVVHVRTNDPYRPAWAGRIRGLRALFRLLPYLWALWRDIGRSDVVHVFANSGWAWHLLAAPALWVARVRGVPAIVNYRGGLADEFLSTAPRWVHRDLAKAALLVTPSAFLVRVFQRHGLEAHVVPNIIDLERFSARPPERAHTPHVVVTRNLERIYDIPTALRAFARIRERLPEARLTVAGSGPELDALRREADALGLGSAVRFAGRIDNERIGDLYATADLMLNPTTADNMPISILEALACGVPVVTTSAGGIPDLVEHERTALLVPVGDDEAMARAALRVLVDEGLAARLRDAGVKDVARYAWPEVRAAWRACYLAALAGRWHTSPSLTSPR